MYNIFTFMTYKLQKWTQR